MEHHVKSEIAANVWRVTANDGQSVSEGDMLVILESMKMEIPVQSPIAGRCSLRVGEGDTVQEGDLIAVIEQEAT